MANDPDQLLPDYGKSKPKPKVPARTRARQATGGAVGGGEHVVTKTGKVHTPVGDAPVIPLIIIGAGMYLVWFGVHYWRSDIKYPTDPIKSLLQGKGLPAQQASTPYAKVLSEGAAASAPSSGSSGGSTGTAPTVSGNYSIAQLEQLWTASGGNAAKAPMAAAIAMAESGGNPNAQDNDSNGSIDRGLWQINSVHGAQSTFDPTANAQAAIMISNNGTDWSPWVTFQTGAYQKYLT